MCTPPLLENSYLRVPKHLLVNWVIRNVFNVQYISCSNAEMWAYGFTCGQLVWSKKQHWHFQCVHIITALKSGSLQLRGISVTLLLTTATEWVVSADHLSAWVVNCAEICHFIIAVLMKTTCPAPKTQRFECVFFNYIFYFLSTPTDK